MRVICDCLAGRQPGQIVPAVAYPDARDCTRIAAIRIFSKQYLNYQKLDQDNKPNLGVDDLSSEDHVYFNSAMDGASYNVTKSKSIGNLSELTGGSVSEYWGHSFRKKTFHKPTFCHHCSDMLWGLTNQGMQCTVCAYVTHERCQPMVVTPCSLVASSYVQIPVAHSLIYSTLYVRRFCNVCRQRIDDLPSYSCQACPYYMHAECRPGVVHNCKLSATFRQNVYELDGKQLHHWSEGHLPISSKCYVCSKSCGSQDCLTGFRCNWCLCTVHSYCANRMIRYCDFGALDKVVLPPYAVSQVNLDVWSSKLRRGMSKPASAIGEDERGDSDGKDSLRMLRIYEGPVLNPTGWRNISISDSTTSSDLLTEALKKFHISDDKTKYYLTRVVNAHTEVKIGDEEKPIDLLKRSRPQLFLRQVTLDNKELQLKVYAGAINSIVSSVDLKVNLMQPARDIIAQAVREFHVPGDLDPDKYSLIQMQVASERVSESYIDGDESLYTVLVENRKQSLSELHSTRFYLQPREQDVNELSLFVGNLPVGLSNEQYRYILNDLIGAWDQEMLIKVVFALQGAVVVAFSSVRSFLRIIGRMSNAAIDGRAVFLRLLPELKEDLLPKESYPLIVYVNSKSGGGQGQKLLASFSRLLNVHQVVSITDGGPLPALYMFRNVSKFRILICGGDGTFSWVLSCLEEVRHNVLKCKSPSVALLPLGTGNDLSRVLNWGAGYSGESPLTIISNVMHAYHVTLDRWNVVLDPSSFSDDTTASLAGMENINIAPMNNYLGIGIDAQLCLEFHLSREENPDRFNSRLYNKGVYFRAGLRNLTRKSMANLQEKLELVVDGKLVAMPQIEGLLILNISSWGAGSDPWGKDRDEKFHVPSFGDGLLEVVGLTGVVHMGKIKSGLSTGLRIAQGTQINLKMKTELPMQVDGEPWLQQACSLFIRPTLQPATMLMRQTATPRKKQLSSSSEQREPVAASSPVSKSFSSA